MKREAIRQGDILLVPVDALPDGQTEQRKSYTVALGEKTGHSHVVSSAMDFAVIQGFDDEKYLNFRAPADIVHQTHGPHIIAPGAYKIVNERELDWFSRAQKKVLD